MYLEKIQLGYLIDNVREVMPHCVIKDVRDRCGLTLLTSPIKGIVAREKQDDQTCSFLSA